MELIIRAENTLVFEPDEVKVEPFYNVYENKTYYELVAYYGGKKCKTILKMYSLKEEARKDLDRIEETIRFRISSIDYHNKTVFVEV